MRNARLTVRIVSGLIFASALLLASGSTVAQPPPADPVVFWYEMQEGIWRVEAGAEPVQIIEPGESVLFLGLDLAPDTEQLYWLQAGPADTLEHIRRANLYGGEQQVVVDAYYGMYQVHNTRVHGDWIYWTVYVSWASGTISFLRAPRDGSAPAVVLPADPPWYIFGFGVDADDGHLYWIGREGSAGPQVLRRSALDATEPTTLITGESAPTSIALDRSAGQIYWSEANRIMRADYDGENVVEVLSADGSVHQVDVDPLAQRVYWTDTNRFVWRARMDGSDIEPFLQLPPTAVRFAIFPRQPKSIESGGLLTFALEQSYPNPASGFVTIRFSVDVPADARLDLFDVLGRRIETLSEGAHRAGPHEVMLDTSTLTPGAYVYRLTVGDSSSSRTFVVTRD